MLMPKTRVYSAGLSKTPVDFSGFRTLPVISESFLEQFTVSPRVVVGLFVHSASSDDITIFHQKIRRSIISGPSSYFGNLVFDPPEKSGVVSKIKLELWRYGTLLQKALGKLRGAF